MNFLANLCTCLSLSCGFFSIIFSLEDHFTFACWAIFISALLDGLDGQIARLNPVPSEFGKELDSLSDVVSFGMAPAVLGYIFIYRDFYPIATTALLVYLLCSVVRLAKYNISSKEEIRNCFLGLPTTVSGGVLASFILIFRRKGYSLLPQYVPVTFVILVIALSLLMVSRIRYLNLDGLKKVFGRSLKPSVIILIVVVMLAAYYKKAGVTGFGLFLIYLIFSPFVVKRLNSH